MLARADAVLAGVLSDVNSRAHVDYKSGHCVNVLVTDMFVKNASAFDITVH